MLPVVTASSGKCRAWALRLQSSARFAAWLVAAIALVGLVAWLTGSPVLGAFGAAFPPILPGGIVILAATAAALQALCGPHLRRAQAVAWPAAAIVALIGGLIVAQHLGRASSDAELTLLPRGYWTNTGSSLGTATTYLLLAFALALAPTRKETLQSACRWFALTVGGIALVALVGFSFRLLWFAAAMPPAGMPLPVVLGLLVASVALVLRQPSARLVHILDHDSPAALVLHRVLPAGIALPLLAGWVGAFGERSGWFDVAVGQGMVTVLTICACTALVLWLSVRLDEMYVHRSRAETRADTHREWLEATLASIDDAVITADAEGRVGFLNPAAEALLGVQAATSVGLPVSELVDLVDERTGQPLACPLKRAFIERRPLALEGEPALVGPYARRCAVEAKVMPILGGDGEVRGGVLLLRDASARRARERQMRETCADLDRRVGERTAELERAASALRESTALLQTFAASTPELIFAKDRKGRFTMVNPAALRAVGLSRAEVIGRQDVVLFGSPADSPQVRETDELVMESGEPMTVEQTLSTCNGERTFLVTKSPLRDEYGQVLGLVGVATDITERKQAHKELESQLDTEHQLRDEAERANRAKDEFLAVVSHELRSPLNALKGWSHVLSGTPNPDPVLVTRATQAIKRNVEHQTRLIDDLLDTSRIISGKLVLERRPVNLVEVVHAAIDLSRSSALAKQIELHFASDHPVVSADGDAGRLQQVIVNLLSNAVKFTPAGGCIDIGLRRRGEWIELEVSDTGMGIEADFLPHVFDRFSQADSSTTRRYSGLGIGLALVRHLVELHGGTVRAASAGAGRGTTFTVDLPAASAGTGPARAVMSGSHFVRPKALAGIEVLAVDDDPDAREVVELAVSQAGGTAHGFGSGQELVDWLLRQESLPEHAVLLLDIAMPGEDGFGVLKRVRSHARGAAIPAIAVTALTHLDPAEFTAAGFCGRLGKPVEVAALVDGVLAAAARKCELATSLPG